MFYDYYYYYYRTAGFNAMDLSLANQAMLVLWIGLMYLSSYPVTITLRQSSNDIAQVSQSSNLFPHSFIHSFIYSFIHPLKYDLGFSICRESSGWKEYCPQYL